MLALMIDSWYYRYPIAIWAKQLSLSFTYSFMLTSPHQEDIQVSRRTHERTVTGLWDHLTQRCPTIFRILLPCPFWHLLFFTPNLCSSGFHSSYESILLLENTLLKISVSSLTKNYAQHCLRHYMCYLKTLLCNIQREVPCLCFSAL